ncbi:unnamed protein product [Callosobruchus maculatus]|uniref:Uncharacterized protein n=1 Tax=Callosobruchus maculatus TaxID=64391 RepID=A0A653CZT3_CALMS|nr:unnamed protein product [Callosobruchus maculatus]
MYRTKQMFLQTWLDIGFSWIKMYPSLYRHMPQWRLRGTRHLRFYPNCRSKNRGTQNFELLHNGLLTFFSMIIILSIYDHNFGLVVE